MRAIQPVCLHLGQNPGIGARFVLGRIRQDMDSAMVKSAESHQVPVLFLCDAFVGHVMRYQLRPALTYPACGVSALLPSRRLFPRITREDMRPVGSAPWCRGETLVDRPLLLVPRLIWLDFQLPVVALESIQVPKLRLAVQSSHSGQTVQLGGSHLVLSSRLVEMLLEVDEHHSRLCGPAELFDAREEVAVFQLD
jgi:hypothetical protein